MKLFLAIFTLILCGCVASDRELLSSLSEASECCTSYDQIAYQKFDSNNEIDLSIDMEKPAFKFARGKAYFQAIELSGDNRAFQVKSFFKGSSIRRYASPVVLELDANYQVLAQKEPKLHFVQLIRSQDSFMTGVVQLADETKYVIIYPSNDAKNTPVAAYKAELSTDTDMGVVPAIMKTYRLTKIPVGKVSLIPLDEDACGVCEPTTNNQYTTDISKL
ncbi:hypothetical protein OAP14_10595 [Aliiglaciecola sp.]|nr:hypothetical protein [Aliiglaciecola sp.]